MTAPSNELLGNRPLLLHMLQERTEEAQQRGLSRLATLLKHADPLELFVTTVASMMFRLPEELTEAQYGTVSVKTEHLAYELFPHFGRSRTSHDIGHIEATTLYGDDIQACQEALDDLLFSRSFKAFMTFEGEGDELISLIRGRTEIFRGNAYPPQTERRIREVQGRFDDWYAKRVGIAPTRAVEALRAIVKE